MPEPKTRATTESVTAFLARIADDARRQDCKTVARLMKAATGAPAKMWGASIVGFGSAPVVYAHGRTMDRPAVAFSPRKGCLYIKSLADVDLAVLEKIIAGAAAKDAK